VDELNKCFKVWDYDYICEVITQPGPKLGRSVSCIFAPFANKNVINILKQKLESISLFPNVMLYIFVQ